jgi:hypothetical protein
MILSYEARLPSVFARVSEGGFKRGTSVCFRFTLSIPRDETLIDEFSSNAFNQVQLYFPKHRTVNASNAMHPLFIVQCKY